MTAEQKTTKNQKARLHRLQQVYLRLPKYLVTACTHARRLILANQALRERFLRFARQGPEHGAWVGGYVLMPDRFHVFGAIDGQSLNLSVWGKSFKNAISKTLRQKRRWFATLGKDVFRSSTAKRRVLH